MEKINQDLKDELKTKDLEIVDLKKREQEVHTDLTEEELKTEKEDNNNIQENENKIIEKVISSSDDVEEEKLQQNDSEKEKMKAVIQFLNEKLEAFNEMAERKSLLESLVIQYQGNYEVSLAKIESLKLDNRELQSIVEDLQLQRESYNNNYYQPEKKIENIQEQAQRTNESVENIAKDLEYYLRVFNDEVGQLDKQLEEEQLNTENHKHYGHLRLSAELYARQKETQENLNRCRKELDAYKRRYEQVMHLVKDKMESDSFSPRKRLLNKVVDNPEMLGHIKKLIYHLEKEKYERQIITRQYAELQVHVKQKNRLISLLYSQLQDENDGRIGRADQTLHQIADLLSAIQSTRQLHQIDSPR